MSDDNRMISLLFQRDEQALVMIREAYGPLCLQIAYRCIRRRVRATCTDFESHLAAV